MVALQGGGVGFEEFKFEFQTLKAIISKKIKASFWRHPTDMYASGKILLQCLVKRLVLSRRWRQMAKRRGKPSREPHSGP